MSVLLGTKTDINKELAYMQLGESLGSWAVILAGIFSLFALLTTFLVQYAGAARCGA